MKRLLLYILLLTLSFSMTACKAADNKGETVSFDAVISEISDTAIIVIPAEGSSEAASSDLISLNGGGDIKLYDAEGKAAERSLFTAGTEVRVVYDASRGIAESYPAQIWALELHYKGSGFIDSPYTSVNDIEYLTMSIIEGSITPEGLTLEFISTADRELIYGSFYALELSLDGRWYRLPYVYKGEGAIGWDDIAYIVPAQGSSQWSTDWSWLYGSLAEGSYRIIKDVYDNNGDGDSKTYYLAAEFTIPPV